MSKPEWGIKRICPKCNKKYYDFNKSPIICPCPEAFEFDPDLLLKSRKGRGFSNKVEETDANKNVSDITEDKKNDVDEDLEVIDNDTEMLEIEEENSIESGIVSNLDEEDEKDLDSSLGEDLDNDIETDEEDLSFIDADLDDDENNISVEVEDKEDKN